MILPINHVVFLIGKDSESITIQLQNFNLQIVTVIWIYDSAKTKLFNINPSIHIFVNIFDSGTGSILFHRYIYSLCAFALYVFHI